ncbi:MAG: type II toxin-antitoxin system VapC family toxin [Deltaproteobacteria bacterium]|nr:type II toxin-antitoxin system VapC family toxin [Deltaproteobacteria bacterium]
MKPVLLDTHVWIWLSIGEMQSLSPKTQQTIARCTRWIAAISCWELAKLVEKRRLGFTIPTLSWIRRSLNENEIRVADLTPEIAVESTELQGFHRDPADQIIVATSRVLGMPLVTADQRIIQFGKVETIW